MNRTRRTGGTSGGLHADGRSTRSANSTHSAGSARGSRFRTQVTDALTPCARALRPRFATVVGGMSTGRQASSPRGGAELVVATPGRLKDLTERRGRRLDRIAVTVLDEPEPRRVTGARTPSGIPVVLATPVDGRRGGEGSVGRHRCGTSRSTADRSPRPWPYSARP